VSHALARLRGPQHRQLLLDHRLDARRSENEDPLDTHHRRSQALGIFERAERDLYGVLAECPVIPQLSDERTYWHAAPGQFANELASDVARCSGDQNHDRSSSITAASELTPCGGGRY
jgi:hypothetical protein